MQDENGLHLVENSGPIRIRGDRLLTVRRVLLHNFHGPNNARLLAIGVVEEGQLTFLHGSEVVPG